MASKPFFDKRRSHWVMKYKTEFPGPWLRVILLKVPKDSWSKSKPPKKPPQDAIDKARHYQEIEYRAKNGIKPAPGRARPLREYLEAYATVHGLTTSAGSNDHLKIHIDQFLKFADAQGVTSVQGVTRAICRDYLEARYATVTHNTLRTERGYLSGAWSRAMEDGLVTANPWQYARAPGKPEDVKITFWTPDEIRRIVEACKLAWHKNYVLLLANTGLRASTALAMTWDWVDWKAGTIRIQAGRSIKTRYTTKIGGGALDVLQRMNAMSKGSTLLFPEQKGTGKASYERTRVAIMKAVKKAGVPDGTLHDLRHSFARHLILAGVPITVVQSQLGHKNIKMTLRYVTTTEEHAGQFMDKISIGI